MKKSLYYSAALHIMLILAMFIGMPHFKHDVVRDYAIVAEVVPISELTNVSTQSKPIKKDVKKANEVSKSPPPAIKDKPSDAKPPKEKSKEKTSPSELDSEKVPVTKQDAKPEKKERKEEKKKDNKLKPQEDVAQDFASSILKSLDAKPSNEKKEEIDFKNIEKLLQGETNKEFNENLPLSMSEIDAIKSQIVNKWNTSSFSGAAAEGMQVVVIIELDINGNVIKAKPELENHQSQYYRAFVESAVRAIHLASPIEHLTKEKYHTWKEIEFRFDSSGMIY